jgi:DNA (cytosine-5)-methyltransferase 1
VDERSILDVRPDDLRGFTQCHFFAGIGVWSHALRRAGWADDRLSGPVPVRASLSARQAKAAGLMTSGTFGPPSTISSSSAGLARLWRAGCEQGRPRLARPCSADLEAGLRRRGGSISALRASVRRISDSGSTGWPTFPAGSVAEADDVGELGHTDRAGRAARNGVASGGEARPWQSAHSGHNSGPGPVNGLWRDADWLFCRDGKWRAVEPGTFPLAHGAAARVGRLRAYGNAIVAPQAEAFIRAYMSDYA